MFRIFSAPVASFQSALGFKSLFIMLLPLLLLTACDDQPDLAPAPVNDKPKIQIDIGDAPDQLGETHAAESFKSIIMRYVGEWLLAD